MEKQLRFLLERNCSVVQRWRRLRWLATRPRERQYALRHGHNWAPCPECGIEFGGHERPIHLLRDREAVTITRLCPVCAYEIGEDAAYLCDAQGHERREFRNLSRREPVMDGELLRVGMGVAEAPPVWRECPRCHLRFDAMWRPAGRPLDSGRRAIG